LAWRKFGVLYSGEVFERRIPENDNGFSALWILALNLDFNDAAIETVSNGLCRRKCCVKLIRCFNLKGFVTMGAFEDDHRLHPNYNMLPGGKNLAIRLIDFFVF